MNAVIDNIMSRASVRSFTDKTICDDDLMTLASCAVHAPCAMNRQLWHFTVLHNKEKMKALAAVIADALSRDRSYDFYSPDALIICSAPRESRFCREDCACALENIFLAAHSMGIGSVWINQLNGICDEPAVRRVLDDITIPGDDLVWGMAALGYPPEAPEPKQKNENVIKLIK